MPESPLTAALLDAAALLLPVVCAGCGADDRALCATCAAAITPAPLRRRLPDGTPVHAGIAYGGVVRQVVVAMKDGRPGLARRLAPLLVAAVAAAGAELADGPPVELCAVPSTRRARRRRGYDPVPLLLARSGLGVARVFAPARPHPAQKTLTRAERAAHLDGVFRVRRLVAGRRFVLVDDVVTTGATLAAASAAIRASGGEVLAAAAVASTPRRVGDLPADPAGAPWGLPSGAW
ncbi:ComF family protein [Pseudolysinimonas sp.]|uniref:ComF family protein n=1 Tax=Pseudolysinimonas sp. TaxID=2680009 RepID=UPI003F7DF43A